MPTVFDSPLCPVCALRLVISIPTYFFIVYPKKKYGKASSLGSCGPLLPLQILKKPSFPWIFSIFGTTKLKVLTYKRSFLFRSCKSGLLICGLYSTMLQFLIQRLWLASDSTFIKWLIRINDIPSCNSLYLLVLSILHFCILIFFSPYCYNPFYIFVNFL